MSSPFETSWFLWSLGIVFLFPVLVVVLGEAVHRLRHRAEQLSTIVRDLRNMVLPALVAMLFLTQVLGRDTGDVTYRVVATLFWVFVLHIALSLLNLLLFTQAEEDSWRAKVPALLLDISRLVLVLAGGAVIVSNVWGRSLGNILTALGVGSIVIGLALQDSLGNIISGIALLFERPFQVGDWLQVDEHRGEVIEINWRAVRLRTTKHELLVLPNAMLSKAAILNYSQPEGLHGEAMRFTFAYDQPPNLVKRRLYNLAASIHGVLPHPSPKVKTLGYTESGIDYEVRFFVNDYALVSGIRDQITTRLWYLASRYGLSMPVPVPRPTDDRDEVRRRLRAAALLAPVDEETLTEVALDTRLESYGDGEHVLCPGDAVEALYIISRGEVGVWIPGIDHEVRRMGVGEFFGELGLLRKKPSTAEIVAVGDTEVLALSDEAVHLILEKTPSLAREFGEAIGSRLMRTETGFDTRTHDDTRV